MTAAMIPIAVVLAILILYVLGGLVVTVTRAALEPLRGSHAEPG